MVLRPSHPLSILFKISRVGVSYYVMRLNEFIPDLDVGVIVIVIGLNEMVGGSDNADRRVDTHNTAWYNLPVGCRFCSLHARKVVYLQK